MIALSGLAGRFTQVMPLADGIYTGLYFLCPNDSRRKRAHSVLFEPFINPYGIDVAAATPHTLAALRQYLDSSDHYRLSPKWQRTGDTIETLSLAPSIVFPCCHGTVQNGVWLQ